MGGGTRGRFWLAGGSVSDALRLGGLTPFRRGVRSGSKKRGKGRGEAPHSTPMMKALAMLDAWRTGKCGR